MVEIKSIGWAGHLVRSKNNEMAARRWSEALRAAKHVLQTRQVQKKYRADKPLPTITSGIEPGGSAQLTGREDEIHPKTEEDAKKMRRRCVPMHEQSGVVPAISSLGHTLYSLDNCNCNAIPLQLR